MKKIVIAIATATFVAATLTGCSTGPSKLEAVYESCGLSDGSSIGDNGATLSIDTMGETEYVGASITDLMCVLDDPDLGVPDYITQAVLETRAIDGRQNDEFDEITMSWSYHPDNGMSLTFHKK
jgi:hypothetical protein